jgi:H+/Cl- antiporter ClcA
VGSLAGASLARKYYKHNYSQTSSSKTAIPSKSSLEKVLAYAGAAGSLTGFMNIPLAGAVFALEMTSRHAGVAASAVKSWSTSIVASLVGIAFLRGLVVPSMGVGGHFDYISRAAVGAVSGREMVLVGLGCGLGGALVGTGMTDISHHSSALYSSRVLIFHFTAFHTVTKFLKGLIWSGKKTESAKRNKYVGMRKKACVAFAIGLLSTQYPQTMFWGEGSLQCMVSGQCSPFVSTPHGLPISMLEWARVNPNTPLASSFDALQVGLAKFLAIALASAGKYPGGVIFPLLSNGAGLSHALIAGVSNLIPSFSHSLASSMMVMSFMAATLTSITRTPLATCLILALTASSITPLSVILPGALIASYISVFASEKLSKESFFEYSD